MSDRAPGVASAGGLFCWVLYASCSFHGQSHLPYYPAAVIDGSSVEQESGSPRQRNECNFSDARSRTVEENVMCDLSNGKTAFQAYCLLAVLLAVGSQGIKCRRMQIQQEPLLFPVCRCNGWGVMTGPLEIAKGRSFDRPFACPNDDPLTKTCLF